MIKEDGSVSVSQEGGQKFGEYLETRIELKQKRDIEMIMEDFEKREHSRRVTFGHKLKVPGKKLFAQGMKV